MSATTVIIGIVLGTLLGAVIIALRNRQQDVFAVLFVAGVAVLAVAVNINGIRQFWEQRAEDAAVAQSQPQSQPSAAAPTVIPPYHLPTPSPMMHGATGSAAPQAAHNPYLRRS